MPITLRITSIFGRESDRPASNRASAGPCPIPEVKRPCSIKEKSLTTYLRTALNTLFLQKNYSKKSIEILKIHN